MMQERWVPVLIYVHIACILTILLVAFVITSFVYLSHAETRCAVSQELGHSVDRLWISHIR